MHGLHFRLVKDGVFDRGETRTNRVEARAVAEAVIDHARQVAPGNPWASGPSPSRSATPSATSSRSCSARTAGLDEFFASGRPEPFFVKNLENIQGDERDVIFISVGYARDTSGYMAMNFGPLSIEGGERRLNVLISRARERCEVFSSITADDIDLQRRQVARCRGVQDVPPLRRDGHPRRPATRRPATTTRTSRRQVAEALEGLGHEVHRQVGTSGFIIDLAVVDPACPGRYLLGIECDGATYHSSRSARDRDRLRESVLRDRDGGSTASGAPTGSTGPTSSSASSSRPSRRHASTPNRSRGRARR